MQEAGIWPDAATLATIASVIAAFSVTMVFFRVQREIDMGKEGEMNWMPWADRMLIAACSIALVFVLLPLVATKPVWPIYRMLPSAACAAAVVLLACYPFALLAHYRVILAFKNGVGEGQRVNPEPGEELVVRFASAFATVAAVWTAYLHAAAA